MPEPDLDDLLRGLGDAGLHEDGTVAQRRLDDRLRMSLGGGRPSGRWSRVLVAIGAALATLATFTATAAVALTAATGSPVPDFARGDTANVFPSAGSTRITDVRAPDPTGGPPWAVRVGGSDGGLVCVGVGQVQGETFGIRGNDGTFRAVPPFGNDQCGPAPRVGSPLVQLRGFGGPDARRPAGATSVVSGAGGEHLRSVRVSIAGGEPRSVTVGDGGTFVLAVPGWPEGAAPKVDLAWDDGTRRTVRLGRSVSVPDPEGRVGWSVNRSFRGPAGCAAVALLRVSDAGGGVGGARVCGSLHGPVATLTSVRAMHGIGPRRALIVRLRRHERVVVRRDGRIVPVVTTEMAGPMHRTRTETFEDGHTEIGSELTPGPGPAASVAILPDSTRSAQLRVEISGRGPSQVVAVITSGGR